MLLLGVRQSDSVVHIHVSILFRTRMGIFDETLL